MDQVGQIEDKVEKELIKEREKYAAIYEEIEKYIARYSKHIAIRGGRASDNRMYIGGSMGINLLLHRPRSLEDYVYELYTENPFIHANNLTNELAQYIRETLGDKYIIMLMTFIPYQKYYISIDNRRMIYINALHSDKRHKRTFTSYDLIKPIVEKSFNKHQVLVLSPEIYLIDIYRKLSSPYMVGEWPETLRNETKLFQLMKPRIKATGIVGGDKAVHPSLSRADQKTIEQALLSKFVNNNKDVVLMGEHALRLINQTERFMAKEIELTSRVIHILTSLDIESLMAKVKPIIQSAMDKSTGAIVTQTTRLVPIMEDFRLTRTTIKAGPEGAQKEIMYIYNSAHYDLVPYNTIKAKGIGAIRIGTPFVLLRFMLINIWVVRWINKLGFMNDNFAKRRLGNLLTLVVALRSKMQDTKINIATLSVSVVDTATNLTKDEKVPTNIRDELFGSKSSLGVMKREYVGQYVSEKIATKLSKIGAKRYPPYHPQRYYRENKSYRSL